MTRASAGISPRTFLGQIFTHTPQPVHLSWSTRTMPFSMRMAPKGQARTQSPNPRQA
jgi:hypothetical protein